MTAELLSLVLDAALLTVGVGVLYFGAEWLVHGAARLAASLGVSPIVVGLTIVSFGTSAPELVVSTVAALGGDTDLAVGNVIGSNLANIGLILGLSSIVRPLEVQARVVWRETPLMLLVTAGLFVLAWDLSISRVDGIVLLFVLVCYLLFVFRAVESEPPEVVGEYADFIEAASDDDSADSHSPRVDFHDVLWVSVGCACLVLGGYCIVEGAVEVAGALGISQVVIGLTVVAVGTSLPELATSLVAAARGEADIAVGNVIGSNIFNLSAILGLTAVLTPLPIPRAALSREFPVLMAMSLLLLPLLRSGWRIRRWEGVVLLASYIAAGIYLL